MKKKQEMVMLEQQVEALLRRCLELDSGKSMVVVAYVDIEGRFAAVSDVSFRVGMDEDSVESAAHGARLLAREVPRRPRHPLATIIPASIALEPGQSTL